MMNRRELLNKSAWLSMLGIFGIGKYTPANEQHHYFDWTQSYTTDQKMMPLQYSDNCPIITCDGVLFDGPVRRCLSGPNGFVVSMVENVEGNAIWDKVRGVVLEETVYGHVVVKAKK